MTKISGLDWSRQNETDVITCGQDNFVKLWNINEPRTCQGMITTSNPVWRARYTPFGEGILTMPQRRDTSLSLYSLSNLATPVITFSGHTDVVREFVWREREGEGYQLVTWGKDQMLRLWRLEDDWMRAVGYVGPKIHGASPSSSMMESIHEESFLSPSTRIPLDNDEANSPWDRRLKRMIFPGYPHENNYQVKKDELPQSQLQSQQNDTNDSLPKTLEEEVTYISRKYPEVHFERVCLAIIFFFLGGRGKRLK